MRILMTGATSDVGRVVFDHIAQDHHVACISRSTGFDLRFPEKNLEYLVQDYDVFLNLANIDYFQGDALYQVYDVFEKQQTDTPKKIISFGSLVTELPMRIIVDSNNAYYNRQREQSEYIGQKLYLEKVHNECVQRHLSGYSNDYAMPQSVLLKLGNVFEKKERSHEPYTTEAQLLEVIDSVLLGSNYIPTLEVRWN